MIFYDTETCGLHGIIVLIQWAEDDGPVHLYSVWTEPVIDTLKLIERLMAEEVCGFNHAFDHFHLQKLYNLWSLVPGHWYPEDHIDEIAELEAKAREGQCIKPKAACDIMLHARKGKYQSTMARKDIRIRKIPTPIAWEVAEFLEEYIKLDDIYFARRKDKLAPKWGVFDRDDGTDFKDVVLKFKASSALKNLAIHALGKDPADVLRFGEIEPDSFPIEVGYAPFATAISSRDRGWRAKIKRGSVYHRGFTWPAIIHRHVSHWGSNRLARRYAEDDVLYTRDLYKHLGSPAAGDDDSELACMVGAVRWKGFPVNLSALKALREQVQVTTNSAPKAPGAVKNYLLDCMDDEDKILFESVIQGSTKKIVLEEVARTWVDDDEKPLPVATRAQEVLDARQAKSELDLIDKLLRAKRFHASFNVIGALSSRMSGGGGDLNPQGVKRTKYIRECFPLADNTMVLCGGDFDSFEVCLAIAYYGDEKLEAAVKSGKKIHALFGTKLYPGMTYDQILDHKEKYTRSKSGVFALIYFGNEHTLKTRLGVSIEVANEAYQGFIQEYPGIGEGRQKITDTFCSMRQPGGIGTAVEWNEPAESIATMFGFKRFFILENQICKALFKLAQRPPKQWKQYKGKVIRRDREQSISGACRSALYAAAFTLQGANTRAAGNHVIQGSGAEITKHVQRSIWDIQPSGVYAWIVQPMNIHDEIMCPVKHGHEKKVQEQVDTVVESYKSTVPLIKMDWHVDLTSWADK